MARLWGCCFALSAYGHVRITGSSWEIDIFVFRSLSYSLLSRISLFASTQLALECHFVLVMMAEPARRVSQSIALGQFFLLKESEVTSSPRAWLHRQAPKLLVPMSQLKAKPALKPEPPRMAPPPVTYLKQASADLPAMLAKKSALSKS